VSTDFRAPMTKIYAEREREREREKSMPPPA